MHTIGVIPGSAAGAAEAVTLALDVLGRLGVRFTTQLHDLGPERYLRTGELLPPDVLTALRSADAVFCGSPPASGDPAIPPGVLERGIVFGLRRELDLAVNVRVFQGVGELSDVDIAVVRENSEGGYFGPGTPVHPGTEAEVVTDVSVNTAVAVRRCVRHAVRLAAARGGRLTLAHKAKVLTGSGQLWERIAREEVAGRTGVALSVENADTCCARLVLDPRRYDVLVTDNVFGDVLSDVACAVARAANHAASTELAAGGGPSWFEPMHGPVDEQAGHTGVDPLGALTAAAALLVHLGEPDLGDALRRAVLDTAARPERPTDLIEHIVARTLAPSAEEH